MKLIYIQETESPCEFNVEEEVLPRGTVGGEKEKERENENENIWGGIKQRQGHFTGMIIHICLTYFLVEFLLYHFDLLNSAS